MNRSLYPLKLAFIGGGINSVVGYTHLIASHMDKKWILKAGSFSKEKNINLETVEKWNLKDVKVYDDWREMLKQEKGKLDAVVIITPTPDHPEFILKAIELGYPVICEKALASSVEKAKEIKKNVDSKKAFLVVTYNYLGYPMLRELKDMIVRGDLGKINHIYIEMPQEGFSRLTLNGTIPNVQTWRLKDEFIPTISLDLGVHLHAIVYFLTGEKPLEVVADYTTYGWFKNIVDNVIAIIKYSNDIRCLMWYSKSALGHRNGLRIRIYGDKKSAEWYQMNPEELTLSTVTGERFVVDRASCGTKITTEQRYNRFKAGHPAGFIEAFANLYVDIADCLLQYKQKGTYYSPYVFGIDVALEGLKLFEAFSVSVESRNWVRLS
ncbi:MAG: Gfo/Idh/MocA family oxidoreductase [Candidatus Omnitrophica bacterium]|nr:Gfo/Idh/MocA family oxidoreductase [Candidatus Omnitrophota bacterium]